MNQTKAALPVGTPIQFLDSSRVKYCAADFPGWGDPRYPEFLHSTAGQPGVVVGYESHGSAPYTRLCINLDNGGRAWGIDPAKVRVTRPAVR
jgi:hypothetical protein